MNDASGKYSGGYFWGNNYWMGSQTQCANLGHNTSTHRKDRGHLAPPFPAAFFVVRAELTLPEAVSETVSRPEAATCLQSRRKLSVPRVRIPSAARLDFYLS